MPADGRGCATLFRQADPLSQSRQTRIVGEQRRQFRRIQVLAGALRAARGHPLDGSDRPILVAETGVDERFLVGALRVRDHPLRLLAVSSARERVSQKAESLWVEMVLGGGAQRHDPVRDTSLPEPRPAQTLLSQAEVGW